MAKASKGNSSHVVPGIDEDPRQTKVPGSDAAVEAPAKPALTSEELRALFDGWKAADKELETIKSTVDAAATKRSNTVKALVEALGNKGPWMVDGVRLSVSVRGDTYSMSKESDAKLTL